MTRRWVIPKSCSKAAPDGSGTLIDFSKAPSALAVILPRPRIFRQICRVDNEFQSQGGSVTGGGGGGGAMHD